MALKVVGRKNVRVIYCPSCGKKHGLPWHTMSLVLKDQASAHCQFCQFSIEDAVRRMAVEELNRRKAVAGDSDANRGPGGRKGTSNGTFSTPAG